MQITDMTALELASAIKAGEVSVREATESFLDAIEKRDGAYHCYNTVCREEALRRADEVQKGIDEGAELVLDGRDIVVPGYENGYFLGPTILDHVKPGMTVGDQEIFGPVTLIKRVKDFDEGLALMNANPFANGSVIFTQSGYYARQFEFLTDGGMVGINVGIPVPSAYFPFSGNKDSFFGDQHVLGLDGVRFYTRAKTVTKHWYDEHSHKKAMDTWEGTVERI